jgi:GNAT superfamily N-acetyltransferase
MSPPVSVRLDDDIRQTLAEEARSRGIGLSAYLRQVATEEARRIRRERIRRQSREVGAYVAATPAAQEFYEDWGSPDSDGV